LVTDPVLLGRVLVNMVKNAFEATPIGGEVRCGAKRQPGPNCGGESEPRDTVAFHVHNAARFLPVVASRVFQRSFTPSRHRTRAGNLWHETGWASATWAARSASSPATDGTVFSIRLPLPAAVGAGI